MDYLGNSDGLMSNLYYYLWMKGDYLKDTAFSVAIPDTIIFKSGLPQTWYFSSKNTGQILMHKQDYNKIENIKEYFLEKMGVSQIVASFIYEDDYEIPGEFTYELSSSRKIKLKICDQSQKISIIYLDQKLFCSFLEDKNMQKKGILQRPFGSQETLIQAVWSPAVCILQKSVNHRVINETQIDPQERCATFGSGEVHSQCLPLQGQKISQQVRDLVCNIVNKVRGITFEKEIITRGVFYFKPDDKNELYFMYCTGIRTSSEAVTKHIKLKLHPKLKVNNTPLSLGQNFIPAQDLKKTTTINKLRPAQMINNLLCVDCEDKCQQNDLYQVKFSQLIRYHEFLLKNKYEVKQQNELLKGAQNKLLVQEFDAFNQPILTTRSYKKTRYHQNISLNRPQSQSQLIPKAETILITSNELLIPYLLRKYYPDMDYKVYRAIYFNEQFMNRSLYLCERCFLKYSDEQLLQNQSNGKRSLDYISQSHLDFGKTTTSTMNSKQFQLDKQKKFWKENFVIGQQVLQKINKEQSPVRSTRTMSQSLFGSHKSPSRRLSSYIKPPHQQVQQITARRSMSYIKGILSTQFITNENSVIQQTDNVSEKYINKLEMVNKGYQSQGGRSLSNRY